MTPPGSPARTAPAPPPRNGFGAAALVLGALSLPAVASLVGGVILGVPAVVLGVLALGRVRRGEATNRRAAVGGIALGTVSVLAVIALIVAGERILDERTDLRDCLRAARGDQEQMQVCGERFG